MIDPILYPRYAQPRLEEALDDTPVVLVHGPRQSGKTTLARLVGDARGFTQRDVRSLAQISSLDVLPRLLQMAAGQTARMVNVSELSAPFQLARPRSATTLHCLSASS